MSLLLPAKQNINPQDRNTEIPFFPSFTYSITQARVLTNISQIDPNKNFTFSWIQAFFDATAFTGFPVLAVWNGVNINADGTPMVSQIKFSYPGEKVNFKGKAVFSSGVDILGDTITSTPIGSTAASDILAVVVYGGMY